MELFLDVLNYASLLIFFIATIIVFTWRPRRGKLLLSMALLFALVVWIGHMVRAELINREIIEWPSMPEQIAGLSLLSMSRLSEILLLCFVVVARKQPLAERETRLDDAFSATAPEPMTVTRALFSFEGRMRRRDYWLKYWLVLLPIAILNNLLYIYALAEESEDAHILSFFISLLVLWPGLAATVKRLHDHNHSGWFLATLLIPFVNIIFALLIGIEVAFLRGTVGPNRFGGDPVWEDGSGAEVRSVDPSGPKPLFTGDPPTVPPSNGMDSDNSR